jgi:hypothetical protein
VREHRADDTPTAEVKVYLDSSDTFPEEWLHGGADEDFNSMARDAARLAMAEHATDGGGVDDDAPVIEFQGSILVKWSLGTFAWIALDRETVLSVDTELADSIYRSDDE